MKEIKTMVLSLLIVLCLVSCGTKEMNNNTDSPVDSDGATVAKEGFEGMDDLSQAVDPAEKTDYSFEGTVFYYGEQTYDVTSRVEAINCNMYGLSYGVSRRM